MATIREVAGRARRIADHGLARRQRHALRLPRDPDARDGGDGGARLPSERRGPLAPAGTHPHAGPRPPGQREPVLRRARAGHRGRRLRPGPQRGPVQHGGRGAPGACLRRPPHQAPGGRAPVRARRQPRGRPPRPAAPAAARRPGRPRSSGRADRRRAERQARRRLPGDPPSHRPRAPSDRVHRGPVEPAHERPAAPGVPGRPGRGRPSRSTRASSSAGTITPSPAGRPRGACSPRRTPRRPSSRPTTSWPSASCGPPGELGRRVPDDLAVVGYDDIELASYTTPPLTTVSQSAGEVGRAAVELLLAAARRSGSPARPPDARDPAGRAGLVRKPGVNRPRREIR